jgi:hypothetical protein
MNPSVTGGFRNIQVDLKLPILDKSSHPLVSKFKTMSPTNELRETSRVPEPSSSFSGVQTKESGPRGSDTSSARPISTELNAPLRRAHRTFAEFQRSLKRESRTEKVSQRGESDPQPVYAIKGSEASIQKGSEGSPPTSSKSCNLSPKRGSILKVRSLDKNISKSGRRVSFCLTNLVHEVECLKPYNRAQVDTPSFKTRPRDEACAIF